MDGGRFELLCEQYYNEILNFVRFKIGHNRYHDTYDITNKTFLKVTEQKDLLLRLNDFAARKYIYSTATNYCRQYFQEIMKKTKVEVELSDSFDVPTETTADKNIKFACEVIKENLSTYTEVEQILFGEYWLKDRKLTEIAEELHINYDNIRQINSRLRNKVLTLVKEKLNT